MADGKHVCVSRALLLRLLHYRRRRVRVLVEEHRHVFDDLVRLAERVVGVVVAAVDLLELVVHVLRRLAHPVQERREHVLADELSLQRARHLLDELRLELREHDPRLVQVDGVRGALPAQREVARVVQPLGHLGLLLHGLLRLVRACNANAHDERRKCRETQRAEGGVAARGLAHF